MALPLAREREGRKARGSYGKADLKDLRAPKIRLDAAQGGKVAGKRQRAGVLKCPCTKPSERLSLLLCIIGYVSLHSCIR